MISRSMLRMMLIFFFAEPEMFLFGIERGIGDERCKWQLEKGVDGNASRIDGSYSGGGRL